MEWLIIYLFLAMLLFISFLSWDIIKRKKWEEALRNAHEKLQKEIELHRKTEKEKERIHEQLLHTQKLEAIGRLAGGIAHDFNNLLTIILGYSDIIMDEISPEDHVYELVAEIKQVAMQACTLPRQLLAFSRKQVLQSEVVNVNHMLKKMRTFLTRLIRKDIKFDIIYSVGDAYVKVDPGQMEQVIMNLVLNSCDAMLQGGKLLISIDKVHINPKISEFMVNAVFGDFVCICIIDTGSGIDKETLPHIFEPFFTTKPQKGTGLGLAVVYGIVKQHDGWIHVESSSAKGTMIKVFLPFYKSICCLDVEKTEEGLNICQGNGEKILLVENNVQVCRFTSRILENNNYKVYKAHNAEEAINIFLENNNWNLLLSNLTLPEKSGLELASYFSQTIPFLPVVLTTGDMGEQIELNLRKSSIKILKKPYSVSNLLFTIRQALEEV